MQTLVYEIEIIAPADTVWSILTGPETYKQWVKAFSPNSYMDGEWEQGSTVRFLDPDMGGTKAILEIVDPPSRILARHIALISKDGGESTAGPMADNWLGTTEDYALTQHDGLTNLKVEIKTHEEFADMFNRAWPVALAEICNLSEKKQGPAVDR